MSRYYVIILVIILVTAFFLKMVSWFSPKHESHITINGQSIIVDVARSALEQQRGLSGRLSLPFDHGMLFVYSQKTTPQFWMWHMFFPLDIVWVADGRIVAMTSNIPAPSLTTSQDTLPRYTPKEPVTMVLEVNAGLAERFGWKIGDKVDAILSE